MTDIGKRGEMAVIGSASAGKTDPLDALLRFLRRRQMHIAPVVFLAPALALFSVFVIYPIIDSLWISLHDWDGVVDKYFIGFGNYEELMSWDDGFGKAVWNNAQWLALFMLAPVLGLALALLLNQTVFGIRVIRSLFLLPFVLSQVVVGLVFSWFYDPSFGLLNVGLDAVGAGPAAPLSSESHVTLAIIVAGLWPQTAYCMILYLTGLHTIDSEQIEAARLDGATGWTMLWNVVLPQLRPATVLAVLVSGIGALRSFDLVAIMTGGGPDGSSTVLAFKMVGETLFNDRVGYGAAVAVVLFLIMCGWIAVFLPRMLRAER